MGRKPRPQGRGLAKTFCLAIFSPWSSAKAIPSGWTSPRNKHFRARAEDLRLARAWLNVAFAEIRRQLDCKCRWHGSTLVAVSHAHTGQRCSACGHVAAGNQRSQAVFLCLACGHGAHAGRHAAQAILPRGTAEGPLGAACAAVPSGGAEAETLRRKPWESPSFREDGLKFLLQGVGPTQPGRVPALADWT